MAVLFNLAIDCDQNADLAAELARAFDGFEITTSDFGDIVCETEHTRPRCWWGNANPSDAGDWHKVCVRPVGMQMPQQASGILGAANMSFVQMALYYGLRVFTESTGAATYRSAWFGWEAQDVLGDADWLDRLAEINRNGALPGGMDGLILAEDAVTNADARAGLVRFDDTHLWWDAPVRGHG